MSLGCGVFAVRSMLGDPLPVEGAEAALAQLLPAWGPPVELVSDPSLSVHVAMFRPRPDRHPLEAAVMDGPDAAGAVLAVLRMGSQEMRDRLA